jgi:hypothetical protein
MTKMLKIKSRVCSRLVRIHPQLGKIGDECSINGKEVGLEKRNKLSSKLKFD